MMAAHLLHFIPAAGTAAWAATGAVAGLSAHLTQKKMSIENCPNFADNDWLNGGKELENLAKFLTAAGGAAATPEKKGEKKANVESHLSVATHSNERQSQF